MHYRVKTRGKLLHASSIQIHAIWHEGSMQSACLPVIAEITPAVHKTHILLCVGKLLQLCIDTGDCWRESAASICLHR